MSFLNSGEAIIQRGEERKNLRSPECAHNNIARRINGINLKTLLGRSYGGNLHGGWLLARVA